MYDFTLDEILSLNNKKIYETYLKELETLKTNRIAKQIVERMYGESINKIYEAILKEETINTSMDSDFFLGDIVLLHESVKECHTKTSIACDFSANLIKKGGLYLNYRPMLENITTKKIYVLKRSIKVEPAYFDLLPTNIRELEELNYKMKLQIEDNYIDYSHLNQVMGGELVLRRLNK